jgi:hypothetical protein
MRALEDTAIADVGEGIASAAVAASVPRRETGSRAIVAGWKPKVPPRVHSAGGDEVKVMCV